MFKSFSVLKSIDNSWTGGSININEDFISQMDEKINSYCQENNLKVSKVNNPPRCQCFKNTPDMLKVGRLKTSPFVYSGAKCIVIHLLNIAGQLLINPFANFSSRAVCRFSASITHLYRP